MDNSPQYYTPPSLGASNARKGSENMTPGKGIGEKADDAFDEKGNPYFKTTRNNEQMSLLSFNMGENCHNLLSVLRITNGKTSIVRKKQDKIGLKNKGTYATICCLEPDAVSICSRDLSGNPTEIKFRSGEFFKTLNVKGDDHMDYTDHDISPYVTESFRTPETEADIRNNILTNVKNDQMKAHITSILDNTAPHYFFMHLTFNKNHHLYGTLDQMIAEYIPSMNLYHGQILKARPGSSITFENSDKILTTLDASTAVDYTFGSQKIVANVEVRSRLVNDVNLEDIFKVDLSVDGTVRRPTDTFYITNKPTNETFKGSQHLCEKPPQWDTMTPVGTFPAYLAFLSKDEDIKQQNAIGGEYKKDSDKLRGVLVKWNKRGLGQPWWPSKRPLWATKHNAGPLRIELSIENNRAIIEMLNVQTDKGNVDLSEAHPCMLRLLDHFMNLATNFSSSKKGADAKALGNTWKPVFTLDHLSTIMKKVTPVNTVVGTETTAAATQVAEHKRGTPKSRRDVLIAKKAFIEKCHALGLINVTNTDGLDELIDEANNNKEKGLLKIWKGVHEAEEWIEENI
jgi:hypothetical protein